MITRADDHQGDADRTEDPHREADDHHSSADGTKDPYGGADDHHSSEDSAKYPQGRAKDHQTQSTERLAMASGAMSRQSVGLETVWGAGWLGTNRRAS